MVAHRSCVCGALQHIQLEEIAEPFDDGPEEGVEVAGVEEPLALQEDREALGDEESLIMTLHEHREVLGDEESIAGDEESLVMGEGV